MRLAFAVLLAVLSPWIAEYLAFGTVDRLGLIAFLAPMYGSGVLLVREAARRTASPWRTVLLLGTAYGVAEACLIDMSLFNPDFDDQTDYTRIARLPVLETGAYSVLSFVGNHVVWSIATPIGLAQSLAPEGLRHAPWLRTPGLLVCAVLYLGGAALIHADVADGFAPSAVQLVAAVAVIAACLTTAWLLRHRPSASSASARSGRRQPPAWAVGVAAFVLLGGWCVMPESWAGVAGQLVVLGVVAVLARLVLPRMAWTDAHTLAVAAAALATYVGVAYAYPVADYPGDHANPATERLSEVVFTLAAAGLVCLGALRLLSERRARPVRA